jgi:hypothetical protein
MDNQQLSDQVIALHRQGCGYTKISKELGVPRTTLRRLLKKSDEKTAGKAVSPMKPNVDLEISKIRIDGDTQMRVAFVWDTVYEYRDEMLAGTVLPPVTVFFDGADYWLSDGFHRLYAANGAGLSTISANVYEGTMRDARRHALGANSNHGLRRTNADKRMTVEIALADEEWRELPNTQVRYPRQSPISANLI